MLKPNELDRKNATDNATAEMADRARKSNLEIFYVPLSRQTSDTSFWNTDDNEPAGEGWFYWCCMPGCLPEGDPIGPFETSAEAYADAEQYGFVNEEEEDSE